MRKGKHAKKSRGERANRLFVLAVPLEDCTAGRKNMLLDLRQICRQLGILFGKDSFVPVEPILRKNWQVICFGLNADDGDVRFIARYPETLERPCELRATEEHWRRSVKYGRCDVDDLLDVGTRHGN
jgi:hypothetical protein